MSFLVEDKQLFREYIGTLGKVSGINSKACDKKLIYSGECLHNKLSIIMENAQKIFIIQEYRSC